MRRRIRLILLSFMLAVVVPFAISCARFFPADG